MSENEKAYNFDFQFQNNLGDIGDMEDKLITEAETRLRKLAQGHTDVTGASIIVEKIVEAHTPYLIRARVVAYTRPQYTAGVEEADTPLAALKGALSAVERQVREERKKLRERWKQQAKAPSEQPPDASDV